MAQLAEAVRATQAIDWRRRIAELSPTIDNKLALAATAVRLEAPPCPVAVQAVAGLAESAKNLPRYHVIAAELALKLGQLLAAERHFEQTAQLDPSNDLHRLNLAVLRLGTVSEEPLPFEGSWSPSNSLWDPLLLSGRNGPGQITPALLADKRAQARMTLQAFRTNSPYSATALRALTSDALRRRDFSEAERFSKDLLVCNPASFDDRLRHLSILRELKSAEFQSFLESLQSNVSTNAVAIYSLASWMTGNGLETEALDWVSHLPSNLCAEAPVGIAFAEACAARHDWNAMETFLMDRNWNTLEYLRFAWLSRATWEQKRSGEAQAHWRLALRRAGRRLGPLTVLLNFATPCGQERGREDVLWQIVQQFPKEKWASRALHELYVNDGNTIGLNRLYELMANYDPKDWVARNNFAATSMLLELNLAKAHELALQLYCEKPQEPVVASTYAFSLHLQGRTKDALAALEKCPTQAFDNPGVALYYGAFLSADGRTNEAEHFFRIARNGELLPQEKRMLREWGANQN